MFNWFNRKIAKNPPKPLSPLEGVSQYALEGLEDRRLMSAVSAAAALSSHAAHLHHVQHTATLKHHNTTTGTTGTTGTTTTTGTGTTTSGDDGVQFTAAPTLVQTGLTTLATAAGATIAATQAVDVDTNSAGTTTYSTEVVNSSGQDVRLTVDATGTAVTTTTGGGGCA